MIEILYLGAGMVLAYFVHEFYHACFPEEEASR